MCDINIRAEIEKLSVKPGECLIVTFIDPLADPNFDWLNETLKESLPDGVKWFYVLGDGVKFSVVKNAPEKNT